MAGDAEIIPMPRGTRSAEVQVLRQAAGDGLVWETERPWSGPGAPVAAGILPVPTDQEVPRVGHPGSLVTDASRGARRARPSAQVRRRRAILLLLVAVTIVTLLALPLRVLAGASSAVAASAPALRPGQVYVVRSGDTLWGIAERLDPTGDPAVLVSRMEQRLGTDLVYPGEHILLP